MGNVLKIGGDTGCYGVHGDVEHAAATVKDKVGKDWSVLKLPGRGELGQHESV